MLDMGDSGVFLITLIFSSHALLLRCTSTATFDSILETLLKNSPAVLSLIVEVLIEDDVRDAFTAKVYKIVVRLLLSMHVDHSL